MENASKALIIAGGILLALMTLTLLVYGLTTTTRISEANDEAKKLEEIENFNSEYLAYNRRVMYGIDLINVINKAINNNAKIIERLLEKKPGPLFKDIYNDLEQKILERIIDNNKERIEEYILNNYK